MKNIDDNDIAIIGMACHFPGCDTVDEYWDNLKNGVNSITQFSKEELRKAGVSEELLENPNYVGAGGRINDIDKFDANFFEFSPLEASVLDPQHRFLLTSSWEALEHAGYNPIDYKGEMGIFAGSGFNYYMLHSGLFHNERILNKVGGFNMVLLNDKNFLATRAAYKLNLKGPAFTVQTACSTSLVAIHNACRSLQVGDCDIALAAGVTILTPDDIGYLYQEGMVLSKDGYCRPFDKNASGFVPGNGSGVVVLKPLKEALEDGDTIHAIIKGTAINNDGNDKTSFSAPTVEGESNAITEALENANISADDIDYVEAHGTGTKLGDPIEFEGLKRSFGEHTNRKGYCAIGSVKSNIGHMDTAAGMGGIIKTALALKHGKIPPTLNFSVSNPLINLEESPFYVNTELSDWPKRDFPSKAGVSAFGIGGTNAHVILEKAASLEKGTKKLDNYSIVFSAKTNESLMNYIKKFINHLNQYPDQEIANIAYTLQVGRASFTNRIAFICEDREDLIYQVSKVIENDQVQENWFIKEDNFDTTRLEFELPNLLLEKEDLLEKENYKELQDLIIKICTNVGLQLMNDDKIINNKASVLQLLTNIWLNGVKVPWELIYLEQDFYRIPLPTYCFNKKRHWIEPEESLRANTIFSKKLEKKEAKLIRNVPDNWFYRKTWKHEELIAEKTQDNSKKTYLIFEDALGLSAQLSERLNADQTIQIEVGSFFKKITANKYIINPKSEEDYSYLIESIIGDGNKNLQVIHAWSLSKINPKSLTKETFSQSQSVGFYSLLTLLKVINEFKMSKGASLIAISNNVHTVLDNDLIAPEKSTIDKLINGIPQENPSINAKSIDIDFLSKESNNTLIDNILLEINKKSIDKTIAYRKGKRWVLDIEPVSLGSRVSESRLKENGVYLITGGLGNIGLSLAEYISKTPKTTIILTGRSGFLEEEKWAQWSNEHPEDSVSKKIAKLQELKKQGANIIIKKADVANLEQMQSVFTDIDNTVGRVDGVIHAAGSIGADYFKSIAETDIDLCEQQFQAKVYGVLVLAEVLKDKKIDFCVLMSSVASVLGGLGMVPYAAANGVMDALIDSSLIPSNSNWITIGWDGWIFEDTQVEAEIKGGNSENFYLLEAEGVDVFGKVLNTLDNKLIVSTTNMQERLDQWIRITSFERTKKKQATPSNGVVSVSDRVSELFKDFLEIEEVSLEDDFFDLGGNSLLSVSFISALNDEFDSNLPLSVLIEERTVKDLATYLENNVITTNEEVQLPFCLVKLNSGNVEKKPIFLIHPIGGSVYFYQDMVAELPSDQPVYGIQSSGLDGLHEPENDLISMAKHYIRLIELVQPEGPYIIGGASFGGMIAYEMVQQLISQGKKNHKLFLIDTPGENNMPDSSLEAEDIIIYYLQVIGADIGVKKEVLVKMTTEEKKQVIAKNMDNLPETFKNQQASFVGVFKANLGAMFTYKIKAIASFGIYFRATEEDEINGFNMQDDWKTKFELGMDVISIPGNHLSMNLRPNVVEIARPLNLFLKTDINQKELFTITEI